jgi:TIR domain-containing protein
MADASAARDRKLRVFISYSRKDEDFAQELLAGLEMAGFEPYLDKHTAALGAQERQFPYQSEHCCNHKVILAVS